MVLLNRVCPGGGAVPFLLLIHDSENRYIFSSDFWHKSCQYYWYTEKPESSHARPPV